MRGRLLCKCGSLLQGFARITSSAREHCRSGLVCASALDVVHTVAAKGFRNRIFARRSDAIVTIICYPRVVHQKLMCGLL